MKILPYHKFMMKSNCYLLNIERMITFKIEKRISDILDQISGKATHGSLTSLQSGILRKLQLLSRDRKKSSLICRRFPITHIGLFVTQKCNLNCVYCYGDSGSYGHESEMTEETAFRSIDWLISKSGKGKNLGVAFLGGEPLLNFKLMKKVVGYAEKRGAESDKKIVFSMTTNATLLDDEIINYANSRKIRVMVSCDGPREIHDRNRMFKDERGSYDVIAPKIKQLLRILPGTTCRVTLFNTSETEYIRKFLSSEFGFKSILFVNASPSYLKFRSPEPLPDKFSGLEREAANDRDELLDALVNKDTGRIKFLAASTATGKAWKNIILRRINYYFCNAGRSYVGISCQGDVFVCHRFVGLKEFKIGNIHSNVVKDRRIYAACLADYITKCSKCFAKFFCGGCGCMYNNLGINNDIFKPDDKCCRLNEKAVENAVYLDGEYNSPEAVSYLKDIFSAELKQCGAGT